MTVALHVGRAIGAWSSSVVVVYKLIIDRVKHASQRQKLGHNVVFLERLAQVGRKVPARQLGRMNLVAFPRQQRRVQVNGRSWYVCRRRAR